MSTWEPDNLADLRQAQQLLQRVHRRLQQAGKWRRMWKVGDVIYHLEMLERGLDPADQPPSIQGQLKLPA